MLVLSRKIGERIRIGDDVTVTVVRLHGDKVRLGIDAPKDVTIHREEVFQRLHDHPGTIHDDEPAPESANRVDPSLSTGQPGR